MKALLYLQNQKSLANSGIGRALRHQSLALSYQGVSYTFDPHDSFDLAHLNSYGPQSYRLLRKLKREGYKVIVHGHSTHEDFRDSFRLWRLMAPFYDRWMDKMYRRADMIITPTPYSKRLIEGYRGVTCPVRAISNGIKVSDYAPDEENVRAFRERFGIRPGEKTVVGVGFYFKRKGLDDFIETARRFPEVRFIWFGSLQRILTSEYMLRCIRRRPSNVMLPGYVQGPIIKGAYAYSSCMLFPTREETEGIVVLEALASRLPVVVRDIPVYEGWLTDGKDCLKARDADGFAKAVSICLESDLAPMRDSGYRIAEARDLTKTGAELRRAYEDLLETKA